MYFLNSFLVPLSLLVHKSLKLVQVRPGLVDLLTETLTKSDSESRRNCADSHESDRISKSRQLSNPEKLQKMPFLQGFF